MESGNETLILITNENSAGALIFFIYQIVLLCCLVIVNIFIWTVIRFTPYLHTAVNGLLTCGVLTNFVQGAVSLASSIFDAHKASRWATQPILCNLWWGADIIVQTLTAWFIVAAILDRFLFYKFSLHYMKWRNYPKVYWTCVAIIWMTIILISLSSFLLYGMDTITYNTSSNAWQCFQSTSDITFVLFSLLMSYIVPAFTGAAIYAYLVLTIGQVLFLKVRPVMTPGDLLMLSSGGIQSQNAGSTYDMDNQTINVYEEISDMINDTRSPTSSHVTLSSHEWSSQSEMSNLAQTRDSQARQGYTRQELTVHVETSNSQTGLKVNSTRSVNLDDYSNLEVMLQNGSPDSSILCTNMNMKAEKKILNTDKDITNLLVNLPSAHSARQTLPKLKHDTILATTVPVSGSRNFNLPKIDLSRENSMPPLATHLNQLGSGARLRQIAGIQAEHANSLIARHYILSTENATLNKKLSVETNMTGRKWRNKHNGVIAEAAEMYKDGKESYLDEEGYLTPVQARKHLGDTRAGSPSTPEGRRPRFSPGQGGKFRYSLGQDDRLRSSKGQGSKVRYSLGQDDRPRSSLQQGGKVRYSLEQDDRPRSSLQQGDRPGKDRHVSLMSMWSDREQCFSPSDISHQFINNNQQEHHSPLCRLHTSVSPDDQPATRPHTPLPPDLDNQPPTRPHTPLPPDTDDPPHILDSSVSLKSLTEDYVVDEFVLLKKFYIILIIFVLCWLPHYIMYISLALCQNCDIDPLFKSFIHSLGYIGSIINPFVYFILDNNFRQAANDLLHPVSDIEERNLNVHNGENEQQETDC